MYIWNWDLLLYEILINEIAFKYEIITYLYEILNKLFQG